MQTFPTTQAFDLSEDQRVMVTSCLQAGAAGLEDNARTVRAGRNPTYSLADEFDVQAGRLRELSARIEAAEYVKLGREVE